MRHMTVNMIAYPVMAFRNAPMAGPTIIPSTMNEFMIPYFLSMELGNKMGMYTKLKEPKVPLLLMNKIPTKSLKYSTNNANN